jgi:sugar O-acyltransferase (sialic acid O-acetyltransferase NeuD family)
MTQAPILVVGVGGHARACVDVIEQERRFSVAGLVGQPCELGTTILGYPVLGTDEDLGALVPRYRSALVAVGQIKSPQPRIRLFELLEAHGAMLPTIVSPYAYVSRHATVGAGSIVMHGAIVNAGATVGRNCIINSHALVEHDVVVRDHCHISTSAAVNGGVRVGAGTFIGSGSCVRQGLTIGEFCLIGMGQRVLVDCDDGTRLPPERPRVP